MSAEDKIIIKRVRLEGEDLSLIDFRQVASVPMSVIKVTGPMFNTGTQYFITLSEGLEPGDIVQLGNYGIKYKIVKFSKMTVKGRLYRIIRVDGYNITQFDIDGVSIGQKARVVSRKSFTQLFEEAYGDMKDFPEACEPCYPENTGVCERKPLVGVRKQEDPVVYLYSMTVPRSFDTEYLLVTYKNQSGVTESIGPLSASKADRKFTFCAEYGTIEWSNLSNPTPKVFAAFNEDCPTTVCNSPIKIVLEDLGDCI